MDNACVVENNIIVNIICVDEDTDLSMFNAMTIDGIPQIGDFVDDNGLCQAALDRKAEEDAYLAGSAE